MNDEDANVPEPENPTAKSLSTEDTSATIRGAALRSLAEYFQGHLLLQAPTRQAAIALFLDVRLPAAQTMVGSGDFGRLPSSGPRMFEVWLLAAKADPIGTDVPGQTFAIRARWNEYAMHWPNIANR